MHHPDIMSKRASTSQLEEPRAKRATGDLNSYFDVPPPKAPSLLAFSDPVTDRQSTFVAHATTVTSAPNAVQFHAFVRTLISKNHPSPADHEILGWRTMELRVGKDGLSGAEEDWTVRTGGDDDEEKNGSNTIKKCLEEQGSVDVAVVISRYYGGKLLSIHSVGYLIIADKILLPSLKGIMLGPDRFRHMQTVTRQVLQRLSKTINLPGLMKQIRALDVEIGTLATVSKPIYMDMTEEKAQRLVIARQKRLEFLLRAKDKRKAEEEKQLAAVVGEESLADAAVALPLSSGEES